MKLALENGPAYPWEIAEVTGLALKTVKNALTSLRKQAMVVATGEVDGRAEQVELIVPASLPYKRDRDEDDDSQLTIREPSEASATVEEVRGLLAEDAASEAKELR